MASSSFSFSTYREKGLLTPAAASILEDFYHYYLASTQFSLTQEESQQLFKQLIELVAHQIKNPHQFEIFHESVRRPFDYYQFGLDFIRPLIDFKKSKMTGLNYFEQMRKQLQNGENVILLANHQTEPDPQILSLLLEKIDESFASRMIFVAGHRVVTDPIAVPMSLGRNLLCIYSKKHIAHPPEKKAEKILHNQRTMKKMSELLSQGGKCIYVAPSGGRDRRNAEGHIEVSPFDPQSLELFWLMAQQAERPTHFYPLSLRTYDVMPPPGQVEKELGEKRHSFFSPVYLSFDAEIDMEHFPGSEHLDKKTKRKQRAAYIGGLVNRNYQLHCQPSSSSATLIKMRQAYTSLK